MPTDFKILADLLKTLPSEVDGREVSPLTEELKTRLIKLARNELPPEERQELFAEIAHHDPALNFLAQQLRQLTSETKDQSNAC